MTHADIQRFLEETTILDPRFKSKVDKVEVWDRIREATMAPNTEAAADEVFEFDNVFDYCTFPLWETEWDFSSMALWYLFICMFICHFLLKLLEQGETEREWCEDEEEEEEEEDYVNLAHCDHNLDVMDYWVIFRFYVHLISGAATTSKAEKHRLGGTLWREGQRAGVIPTTTALSFPGPESGLGDLAVQKPAPHPLFYIYFQNQLFFLGNPWHSIEDP